MRALRWAVFLAAAGLMTVGYFQSQAAFFTGTADRYARAIDVPTLSLLSLILFLALIALAFVPDRVPKKSSEDPE